jgi:hypothetical protein
MVDPITIGTIIAGIGSAIVAIGQAVGTAVGQHPVIAYFLILMILLIDGGISFTFNIQGLFGVLVTFVINQLGVPIQIMSWHLLILIALSPIVFFSIKASVQS